MKAVYKKELKAYFQSIIGCVFIAFLIAFTGIYFMAYNMTTGYPYFSYTLSGSLIVFIVGIPLITMRSFDSASEFVESCGWKIPGDGDGNCNPESYILYFPSYH